MTGSRGTSKISGNWTENLGIQMKRPNICQFVGQKDVSASQSTVYVCHSFLARSKLLISWLQSPSTVVLEDKMKKFAIASNCFPSICLKNGA